MTEHSEYPLCDECSQPIDDESDAKQCEDCLCLMHWGCSIEVPTDDYDAGGCIYVCRECYFERQANAYLVEEGGAT